MAIRTGMGKLFAEELPLGIHALSEGTDVIKCAFYGPNADIGPNTDSYTTVGEIAGAGYTAGGPAVPLVVVGATGSGRNAGQQFEHPYIQPADDLTLPVPSVGIRGCMLYNESQGNRNIFTLDFGQIQTPSVSLIMRWGVAGVDDLRKVLIPLIGRQF